jgi:hypothetical protein
MRQGCLSIESEDIMSKSWKYNVKKMDRTPKTVKNPRKVETQSDLREIMQIVNRTGEKLEDLFD